MSPEPRNIDEYLAPLSSEKRAALEKPRRAIKSAAPRAEECISYRIPAFRLGGRRWWPSARPGITAPSTRAPFLCRPTGRN